MSLKKLLKLIVLLLEKLFLGIEIAIKWSSKIVSKLNWKSLVVSIVGFLFSAWGVWTYYKPDIDVVFSEPLKSDNIFTSRFTIENNGNSNVYDFKFNYYVTNFSGMTGLNTIISGVENGATKKPACIQKNRGEQKANAKRKYD